MVRLTAKAVENAKPGEKRREIPDSGCRGLYFIVQPTGRKAWAVRYRHEGRTRKLTLNVATLADARRAATAALHELEQGRDPAVSKLELEEAAQKAADARAADTVEHWANTFIERYAKKRTRKNSWRQTEHIFHTIALPAWQGRTVHDIRRRDIIELVEGVAEQRPIMANRVLAALSKFFNWLCERDVIAASPCAGVKRPSEERARDRILSDDEIRALWAACDAIGDPAGAVIKTLLLTGQRRSEVAAMRRREIADGIWTLPPERMKNKQRHDVPLSTQAAAIINAMPRHAEGYVFSSGKVPFHHFDRVKRALDVHMRLEKPWVVHDLRRTVASGMAKLGIALPTIEKVLGHAGGSFRGIVGVYQRHDYAAEKRQALQRWADHIDELVGGRQ